MPLTTDEKLLDLSDKILATFAKIFGEHPGIRPAHGKGTLLSGTFTPAAGAAELSIAPHFERAATPVVVRFSDSTGLPNIPDTDPNSLPKGIAIRFVLGEREHTDVIAHSADAFPTRTGDEFLEFLEALATSDPNSRRAPRWRVSLAPTRRRCVSCSPSHSRPALRTKRISA